MVGQTPAPRREVGEDEDPLAGGEHRLDDLLESGQLARSTGERLPVVAIRGRVVADLLERGDGREDRALLGLAERRGIGHVCDELVEHRLVQPDLLGCHRAVVELVDLVGKLGGDFWLGLGAAEQQHAVQRPQRCFAVARHLGDERTVGTRRGPGW